MATPSAAQRVAESPDVLEVIFEHCGLVRVGTELRRVHSSWRDLADTLPRRWATATIAGRLGNFGAGPAELELDDPECAVHLPDGGLAVTDTCNHRIQFFRPECASAGGTPFRSVGRRGSAPGEFNGPMGLATDGTHLFVVDCDNARVQQLRLADGVCVDSVGTRGSLEGQMLRPSGIARSPGLRRGVNAEQGDRLYVADTYNHRISVFGVAPLRFLFCFGREGATEGLLSPAFFHGVLALVGPSAPVLSRCMPLTPSRTPQPRRRWAPGLPVPHQPGGARVGDIRCGSRQLAHPDHHAGWPLHWMLRRT